jgi:hypothetical protein
LTSLRSAWFVSSYLPRSWCYYAHKYTAYKIKTDTDLDTLIFGKETTEKKGPQAQEDAPVQEATAEQKFTQMKMEARMVCQNMLLHMGDMRKELLQTTVLSEALKYAQIMRRVKEARLHRDFVGGATCLTCSCRM